MIFPGPDRRATAPRPTPLFGAAAAESVANLWTSINGRTAARVYSDVKSEYAALTEDAALVDAGPLIRYTVRGYEAAPMLARLTSAPVSDLTQGESGRGLVLSDEGFVVDHAEVTRLSGDLYLLQTSASLGRRLQLAARGLDVQVENIAATVAVLAIIGPEARGIAAMAGFEVASGFLASQSRVRGVETFVRPLVIGGTEGVEIIYPAEEALVLWERIKRVRKTPPAGLDALSVLRIEAGLPAMGLDFTSAEAFPPGAFRPADLGLPHLAPVDRAWFNGRRALGLCPRGTRRVLAVAIDGDETPPRGRVYDGSGPIGPILSSGFSWRRRAAVAFVEVPVDASDEGLSVDILDEGPAQVAATPLSTPESLKAAAFLSK